MTEKLPSKLPANSAISSIGKLLLGGLVLLPFPRLEALLDPPEEAASGIENHALAELPVVPEWHALMMNGSRGEKEEVTRAKLNDDLGLGKNYLS